MKEEIYMDDAINSFREYLKELEDVEKKKRKDALELMKILDIPRSIANEFVAPEDLYDIFTDEQKFAELVSKVKNRNFI